MSEHKILFSVLHQSGSHKDNNFLSMTPTTSVRSRDALKRSSRFSLSAKKKQRERELAVETIFFAFFRRAEVSAWQERRAIHAREK